MTSKEAILNMKIKDIVDYCDNHLCMECPYQSICIFKTCDGREYTIISMLSSKISIKEWLEDETTR